MYSDMLARDVYMAIAVSTIGLHCQTGGTPGDNYHRAITLILTLLTLTSDTSTKQAPLCLFTGEFCPGGRGGLVYAPVCSDTGLLSLPI